MNNFLLGFHIMHCVKRRTFFAFITCMHTFAVQVALEFYQRKRGRWPFATENIPWEVWTLRVNVVSLNNEHGKY